jgi:hypothetical protein
MLSYQTLNVQIRSDQLHSQMLFLIVSELLVNRATNVLVNLLYSDI